MSGFFEEVTHGQIRDFMRRTDPRVEGAISRAWFQAFLDGHLVPRDGVDTEAGAGRIMDISSLIEAMIQHGVHKVTDNGNSMRAAQYRKLWPKTVVQPNEYASRFDHVLLVDTTVELAALVACGNAVLYTNPASCQDNVPVPTREDGAPLTRYVAFFQDGAKNKNRSVEDCCDTFAPDEVGLVTAEGLHLPIQHGPILRDHGVDIPGSRDDDWYALGVGWFDNAQPGFGVSGLRYGNPRYGSASRGSVVIPVT